ncbi:PTS sugar transporter subunit IIA [Aurantimonas endophytica]|uniref:PTS sugar transporter subunit IIA n=1 Tax=Aurantimonas endophytica TaxID=1522175 RepID=UPI003AB98FA6
MAEILANDLGIDARTLKETLFARERLGITAIGKGAVMPHAKSDAVLAPIGAFVQLAEPLLTSTSDHIPVDLFVCNLSPTVDADLVLLADLVREMRDEAFLRALRAAPIPAATHACCAAAASRHVEATGPGRPCAPGRARATSDIGSTGRQITTAVAATFRRGQRKQPVS